VTFKIGPAHSHGNRLLVNLLENRIYFGHFGLIISLNKSLRTLVLMQYLERFLFTISCTFLPTYFAEILAPNFHVKTITQCYNMLFIKQECKF